MTDESRPPDEGAPEHDTAAAEETSETTELESVLSADDESLQRELEQLQRELDRLKELYLRKLADFDNYRKRQEREMMEFRRFAQADLVRDCLPVLDNLERAIQVVGGEQVNGLRSGVELVCKQFREVLGKSGLSEIAPAGEPFDPAQHEAIARQESAAVTAPTVVQVLQKGYRLSERLLRPALVTVAVPIAGAVPGTDSEESDGQDHRD